MPAYFQGLHEDDSSAAHNFQNVSILQAPNPAAHMEPVIYKLPVIAEPGHFVLSSQFSNALHIFNESILSHRPDPERLQNIAGDQVIVINVFCSQIIVHFQSKKISCPPACFQIPRTTRDNDLAL